MAGKPIKQDSLGTFYLEKILSYNGKKEILSEWQVFCFLCTSYREKNTRSCPLLSYKFENNNNNNCIRKPLITHLD